MDWGKVFFIFFSLMSLTSIAGYLYDPNVIMLFIAMTVNFMSTTMKIGVKKLLSAELLASSLVADFHLIPAFIFSQVFGNEKVAFALVIGGLIANIVSTILVFIESSNTKDNQY